MARYFIEISYRGTIFSGFQVQENAITIQAEIEKAFATIQRSSVQLTGSSRTDAGVHAYQNFFHFDFEDPLHPALAYKMNAILPADIAVKGIYKMPGGAHSRFDAISREYLYHIYTAKDPFRQDTALFYPFRVQRQLLEEAAALIMKQVNFFAFAKTNSQVKNFNCRIIKSEWIWKEYSYTYNIEANRFLRGMVRMLTATQLQVGRGRITLDELAQLFESNERKCSFSVPSTGLFLNAVKYPENYFPPQ